MPPTNTSAQDGALMRCFSALNDADSPSNATGSNTTTPRTSPYVSCDFNELARAIGSDIDLMRDPVYITIVVVLYVIVVVLGTFGNLLVVLTVTRAKCMQNPTNIFIANLALADIFVCVFDLPLNAHYQITGSWAFGAALCHVIPAAFAVVVFASTLSLTMIAIDRYLLIVKPSVQRMSIQTALLLVVIAAITSITVASPIAIYAVYYDYHDTKVNYHQTVCSEAWPSALLRRLYSILTLVFQFVVPLAIIALLYLLILRRVRNRMLRVSRRRSKVTKMSITVVAVFAVTWVPFHVFSLLNEFHGDLITGKAYRFTDSILRVVAMSSSCINPFLYGWLNDNYRAAFLTLVRRPTAIPLSVLRESGQSRATNGGATSVRLPRVATGESLHCMDPELPSVRTQRSDFQVGIPEKEGFVKCNNNDVGRCTRTLTADVYVGPPK